MAHTAIRLGYISVSGGGGGGGAGYEEYTSLATFPPTGEDAVIYLALNTNKIYRWNGMTYIQMSPSEVTSVNTQVGAVVLAKADIGLGQVDNTSDLNKPISTATQDALDDLDDRIILVEDHVTDIDNPHSVTKTQLGLENVDNTSDLNKPISTATQTALDLITDVTWTGDYNNGVTYTVGQGVMYNGASFRMISFIGAAGYPPASYPGSWLQVTDYVSANDIGLGNVDNTSDLDKPISSATQTALNNLESSFVYSQVIYIDKNKAGVYTPNGSLNKPYKSIEEMYNAITDASASKRYACLIAPGTYTEASTIRIKGWIDLTAFATDTVIIGVSGGVTLKWSNNNSGRVFIKDIGFTSGLEILNDNPTGTSGLVFDLDNVDAPSLILRGRGGGRDFIQLRNDTRVTGACTIQSAAVTIFDSTGIGTLAMNDIGCVFPDSFGSAITASLRSNYIGAISISATNYDIYTDAWGTIIAGNLTIASNASSYPCYYNYDATSYPLGTVTLTGTNPAQLVRTSKAESIRYTPAVSGNWTVPVPVEVKDALDNLAANKIAITQKGAVNGVASLDGTGKVPSAQLPSYVDDVLEFANLAALPATGTTGIIYITIDTNRCYRWSGSAYIEVSPAPVTSVNGKTNAVTLNAIDIPFSPTSTILSTDVQAAIEEVEANSAASTAAIFEDTKEPTGFINRTDSTTSFVDGSRLFTIAPVSASFSFYIKGEKFTKTTSQEITIPNLAGNHYIYFNASGVLESTQIFSSDIIEQNAFASVIYWNTDLNTHTYFAEERHGITMDGATHIYLHTTFGARYLSGLALQGFTPDGNGSLDAHAQFTADEGSIRDEDILLSSAAQAQIPILFRQGQLWRKKAADAFPLIYSGTAGYTGANGRIPYNQLVSGSWQLTQVSSANYVLVHFFATNDKENPIVGIQGIAQYNNAPQAKAAASTEITSLSGLPFAEFVAIGTVLFQSNTYTNTPDARVVSVNGATYIDFRGTQLYTPAGEATTHSLLSGLSSDDHIQYHTDARGDIRYYTKSQVDTLITGITSPGDIDEKLFSISNSQALPDNVHNFVFSNSIVRAFEALVSIEIVATASLYETVKISGVQKGSDWDITLISSGDVSGVTFSITPSGQIQYTSDNVAGFVSGILKFRAITTSV